MEFSSVEMSAYPGWKDRSVSAETQRTVTMVLSELIEALRPIRQNFGWRVIDDVVDFVALGEKESGSTQVIALLDCVIFAKVLPKLRGDDNPGFRAALDQVQQSLLRHGLTQSGRKVKELADDLLAAGSARFWR